MKHLKILTAIIAVSLLPTAALCVWLLRGAEAAEAAEAELQLRKDCSAIGGTLVPARNGYRCVVTLSAAGGGKP